MTPTSSVFGCRFIKRLSALFTVFMYLLLRFCSLDCFMFQYDLVTTYFIILY